MNMDYSLSQAFKTFRGISRALLMYDVMCQYGVKLRARFARSGYLTMPAELEIAKGIGQFHVHGHKPECYPRFSPNFIPGVGQLDGEIIETLWASLNHIAPSTRAMTAAHRREVIDDHMNDSNWKKLTGIGGQHHESGNWLTGPAVIALCAKYKKAVVGAAKHKKAFQDLDGSVSPENRALWTAAEKKALDSRNDNVTAMDIFEVNMAKGKGY